MALNRVCVGLFPQKKVCMEILLAIVVSYCRWEKWGPDPITDLRINPIDISFGRLHPSHQTSHWLTRFSRPTLLQKPTMSLTDIIQWPARVI